MKTEIMSLDELKNMTDSELEELIYNAAGTKEGASILLGSGKVAFSFAKFQMFDVAEFIGDSYEAAGRISIAICNLLVDGKIKNKELIAGSGKLTYVAVE